MQKKKKRISSGKKNDCRIFRYIVNAKWENTYDFILIDI